MNTLHFGDITEFCDFFIDRYAVASQDNKYAIVNAIGNYDMVKDMVEYLVCQGMPITSMEIEEPSYNGYDNDYVLELDDYGICVEKAYREGTENGYFHVDGEGVYILYPSKFPTKYANNGVFGKDTLGLHYIDIGEPCQCEGCSHDECECEKEIPKPEEHPVTNKKDQKDENLTIRIKIEGFDDMDAEDKERYSERATDLVDYFFDIFDYFPYHRHRAYSIF